MQQEIKTKIDLDKLITDISSPTANINLQKFQKISSLINENNKNAKYFATSLKQLIQANKHPKTQIAFLELIEYTTLKTGRALHNEYNNLEFLKVINSIFNQKNLSNDVREKALFIFQFWNDYFNDKKDLFPNFEMVYRKILSTGAQMPNHLQSKYLSEGQPQNPPTQNPL